MVITAKDMDEVKRLLMSGKSKSDIAQSMGKTKKWVEKALPRSIREKSTNGK